MTSPPPGPPPYGGPPQYGGQPQFQPPPPQFDDAARLGPDRFAVRVHTHTGLLIVGLGRSRVVQGSYDECAAASRAALTHCLVLGWWGVISLLVMNPIAITRNVKARGHLRTLAGR